MLSLQALRSCAFKSTGDYKLQDVNTEFARESRFAEQTFFSLHMLWVTIPLGAAAWRDPHVSGYSWQGDLSGGETPHPLAVDPILLLVIEYFTFPCASVIFFSEYWAFLPVTNTFLGLAWLYRLLFFGEHTQMVMENGYLRIPLLHNLPGEYPL